MTQKICLLTLLLTIGFTTQYCNPCSCPPVDFPYFDIYDVQISHIYTGSNSQLNEPILFNDYRGLRLEYIHEVIANRKNNNFWNFSLMNSAYGCSCTYDGWNGSKDEKLENITIITLNDFDDNHLANDTINDLFAMSNSGSIENYIKNMEENIRSPYEQFILGKAPVLNKKFKAKMIVELSTGEIYEAETEEIEIE